MVDRQVLKSTYESFSGAFSQTGAGPDRLSAG
jgi:hypothetical protein